MHSLARSRPVRVLLERDGVPVSYDVATRAPCGESVRPLVDVSAQMSGDGLSLASVTKRLRSWARHEPDVELVTISYVARRYALAILLDGLSRDRMVELQMALQTLCAEFGPGKAIVYIVGPEQRDSSLFRARDCCVVHARTHAA